MVTVEKYLKAFKAIIFSMALVLVGGILFIGVTVYQRSKAALTSQPISQNATLTCPGGLMELPLEGKITSLSPSPDGKTLFLLVDTPQHNQQVMIVSYCDNKAIGTIRTIEKPTALPVPPPLPAR